MDTAPGVTRVADDVPVARIGHSMVVMADRRRLIVFGGCAMRGRFLNDCWEYDLGTFNLPLFSFSLLVSLFRSLVYYACGAIIYVASIFDVLYIYFC